jgi:hypothetical protein
MAIDWDKAVLAPVMGVFGEAVTYSPSVGTPFAITGIFDEAYHEVDLVEGAPVNTVIPILGVRLEPFSVMPSQGDTLTITRTGESYVVRDVRVDGKGGAKLLLNEAT